jgi:ABC-type transporter Mla subunit MlaD
VRRVIVLLAAVGLVAAGCGGGGSSSESPSPPLTKAQYQAKLQQLSNEVGAELRQSIGASTSLKESDIPKLQASLRSFAGKVAALSPPAPVEDLHTRLVAAVRSLADDLPSLLQTVNSAKDPSAAIAALFGAKPIQALISLQQAYKDKGYDISSLLDAGSGP